MNYIKHIFLTLGIVAISTPLFAFAVGPLDIINVKLDPKTPGVNEEVKISLESFAMDLDSSSIVWYVNKDPIKQGIGEKTFTMQTGEFGGILHVQAVILTPLGKRIEKNIDIAPAEIDFLWEAQTYTPPFYKGKALPTYKSLVKVTAIPRYNSPSSDPKNFSYLWKYNRTMNVGQGMGRNSALIQMGYADTAVPVNVDITGQENSWTGSKSVNIKGTNAIVRFYEQAPLLGVNFNHALSGSSIGTGNQFTIKAVPYFFSTDDFLNDVLIYTWKINNSNIVPGLDSTVVTATKSGQGKEDFHFDLKIQTPKHLLQEGASSAVITLPEDQQ